MVRFPFIPVAACFVVAACAAAPGAAAWGSDTGGSHGARALPAPVAERIAALDAADFETREAAARWLIVHRAEWIDRVPEEWEPAAPEARWRWRWIERRVAQLARFRYEIGEDSLVAVSAKVSRLRLEVGDAILDELVDIARVHPRSRLRQRAVELLGQLAPNDLEERLTSVVDDGSPWVFRTVLDVAAQHDAHWFRQLLRDSLAPSLIRDEERIAEAAHAIREHRLGEFLEPLRALWPELSVTARVEVSLALSGEPHRRDLAIYFWMIESGDYRVLMDGIRALEEVSERSGLTVAEVGRFAEATFSATYPEVRTRAQRLVERHGASENTLELLPFLESDDRDLRRFVAVRMLSWKAEDFYADLRQVVTSWPEDEQIIQFHE